MMFFALSIILTQALAIQASYFSHPGDDAEALCAGKNVDLVDFMQLNRLGFSVPALESCPDNIKSAVQDLLTLVTVGMHDLCAISPVDKFKEFYVKYLDTSLDKKKEKLPKSLRRFAIAYGMQVSNKCKKKMVQVLAVEKYRLLSDEDDFAQFQQLTNNEGPVAQVLGALGGPDEIIMPGDLAPFLRDHGVEQKKLGQEKLFMQTATGAYIKKLQSTCQHRFKPVYEPLIVPLVRLANIGFNYKDDPLKCTLKCPTIVREVGQWSRIVFLCESLEKIQIVEEKADAEQAEGSDLRMVRILTKEEAAAIEGSSSDTDSQASDARASDIVYKPKSGRVSLETNLIFDKSDGKLVKAIKALKTSRTEEETIRKRMASMGYTLIRSHLKQGHVGLIISSTYKAGMKKFAENSEIANPTELIVKELNELVEKESGALPDGAVSKDFFARIFIGILLFVTLCSMLAVVVVPLYFGIAAMG